MTRRTPVRTAVVAAAVLLAGAGPAHASGSTSPDTRTAHHAVAAKPAPRRIAALFDRWNAALATRNARTVAALYAPDAVLLPTQSSEIRTTHDRIVDYFEHFLQQKPRGRVQERHITVLGPRSAIDTGLYEFTLTDKNGKAGRTDARYTFVYELRGGHWLIVNHHSSVVP
ncbi:SgcJ/EcaC family oxidoreductase [Streptomyces olivoreticuli]|uniref:SgcJ/EcaC family oxidoreductase n=1 Tax=Streptomyces olivoreticuli TaxID=68246 RepID=UPI002658FA16|nr:SgcJ/EcaC family oxidoreductase [Streptomyces olivoreticuli]WKK26117.1 SgcJ/EcaC family oxidoreductase [Streptomyces olivoreticuli]